MEGIWQFFSSTFSYLFLVTARWLWIQLYSSSHHRSLLYYNQEGDNAEKRSVNNQEGKKAEKRSVNNQEGEKAEKRSVNNQEGKNSEKKKSVIMTPSKRDEDKGKVSSTARTKSAIERLEDAVRDFKITFLGSLETDTDKEFSEWKQLADSLKSEYPKYTPLLAKILEVLLAQKNAEDKICYYEEVVNAADEVIDSVDREDLPKYFWQKSPPEDDSEIKLKFEMEVVRLQLAEALYHKGLALAEIESLKGEKVIDNNKSEVAESVDVQLDLFEENFKEFRKWADITSSRYGLLSVIRERRKGKLRTALKMLDRIIRDEEHPPKKKLRELRLSLVNEIG